MLMPDSKQLYDAIVYGDAKASHEITDQALKAGADPLKLVDEFMIPPWTKWGGGFNAASISCRNS